VKALSKVTSWLAVTSILESVKDVTGFVSGVVAANPPVGLPAVLDPLVRGIVGVGIDGAGAAVSTVTSKDALCWYFHVMSGAVKLGGSALLPVIPAIVSCLKVGLSHDSRKVQKRCGKVLRSVLKSFLTFYTVDWKSLPVADVTRLAVLAVAWDSRVDVLFSLHLHDLKRSGAAFLCSGNHWQKWATPFPLHRAGIEWHIPTDAEVDAARQLLVLFAAESLAYLTEAGAGLTDGTRSRQHITRLTNCIRGAGFALGDLPSTNGGVPVLHAG
jgi:hypothetical protein